MKKSTEEFSVTKVYRTSTQTLTDHIAVEEPLEMQLSIIERGKKRSSSLAVTMRSPGADKELAVGYLFTEGIIGKKEDITNVEQIVNTIRIQLREGIAVELEAQQRRQITHSSCGICGKPSLESIEKVSCYHPTPNLPTFESTIVYQLQEHLMKQQQSFNKTGGMHAAALFDVKGQLLQFREDIGRHNALDKIIGSAVLANEIPLREQLLFLSGRISYELVQKASLAGIPIIIAVGAPSSLAINLAITCGITLIGFVKLDRFNIYCGGERVNMIV